MTQEQLAQHHERRAADLRAAGHPRSAALYEELGRRARWLGWVDDTPPQFGRYAYSHRQRLPNGANCDRS